MKKLFIITYGRKSMKKIQYLALTFELLRKGFQIFCP